MEDKLVGAVTVELRGSNLDLIRRRNLSLVLTRVHHLGGISRAQLTKETGLNRSTIADLVAELVTLHLVHETEPDPTKLVGRPSAVVVPSDRAVVMTVHPELDAVTVGTVTLGGTVIRAQRHPTSSIPTVDDVVAIAADAIAALLTELGRTYRITAIGLAVPGLVRASDGLVTLAPHLDWQNEPIGDRLRAATGYPVVAGNDASLGAIAESIRGVGRGFDDVAYLNGGASGIGGGVISSGILLGGVSGYAGEIGHTLVNSSGTLCHCGATGCLETEVTRSALLDALDLDLPQAPRLEEALAAGIARPAVRAVVDRQVGHLARALANTVNIFNPRIIVLGGFLAALHAVAGDTLASQVRSLALAGPRDDVQFAAATLGADILMVGAAEVAFASLLSDPAGSAS